MFAILSQRKIRAICDITNGDIIKSNKYIINLITT